MTEFLQNYNLLGLAIGAATFLIIGLFHPFVIKGEYYFGVKCWWAFLIVGIIACVASIFCHDLFWQSILAVTAFSSFWGIGEVFEQRKRVERGWFPKNLKREG